MDVSVIIINFNTFEFTSNCISSIYQHTSDLTCEIILVDNASTECNPEAFKKKFPEIILIKNTVNEGFSKGNNTGISKATAPIILLLNSDTILVNNAIKIAKTTLESNPALGAVSVRLQFPDSRIQKQCERLPSVSLILIEKLRLHKLLPGSFCGKLLLGAYFNHLEYVEPETIWGTFFMFKREALNKMPGSKLNDDYFMYFEDTQWCVDLKKSGFKIAYQPLGIVNHLMGQSQAPKTELMKKNQVLFLKGNYNPLKVKLLKLLGYF